MKHNETVPPSREGDHTVGPAVTPVSLEALGADDELKLRGRLTRLGVVLRDVYQEADRAAAPFVAEVDAVLDGPVLGDSLLPSSVGVQ